MDKNDRTFGSGFIWLLSSIFLVALPTFFSYIFRCISADKIIKISEFYDSILLIVFSVSCSLAAICLDIKSKLINIWVKKIVLILSCLSAVFYGLFYFYLYGMSNPTRNIYVLYVSIICMIVFSLVGFFIANEHNQYDEYIQKSQIDILNKKKNKKNNKTNNKKNNDT